MPVRDVDAYGPPGARDLQVLGNRGASGIDGIVSSVLGCAGGGAGPVAGLIGDIAFYHDMNGLLASRDRELNVVFVLVDNDGGGIFHMLPIREFEPVFTPYFATPHGLDFRHAARLYGLPFADVATPAELEEAVAAAVGRAGTEVIRVRTDREPEPAEPRTDPRAGGPPRERDPEPRDDMTATAWQTVKSYEDITYKKREGVARVAINRPEVRNAFRPETLFELLDAFADANEDSSIGVVLLTGEGPAKDGKYAFCAGGDQRVRGESGYVGRDGVPRLNVLVLQRLIRTMPKPVIALVAGYAIGGGHVLHVVCDLTIAADNAVFGQTGPKVGSFDGGFGSSYLARIVGHKKAREIWYLCRQYDASEAEAMGLVNKVVPVDQLEDEGFTWAREILAHSPPGDPRAQVRLQRRRGRAGRAAGAGRERHPPLLHDRAGPGGPRRIPGEAQAGLREVPLAAVVTRKRLRGFTVAGAATAGSAGPGAAMARRWP